jgi:hypothetical protein
MMSVETSTRAARTITSRQVTSIFTVFGLRNIGCKGNTFLNNKRRKEREKLQECEIIRNFAPQQFA